MTTLEHISDEEYFGELKLLFKTTGWELILAELLANADIIGDLQTVTTEKDLYFRQGQLASIGTLMNFEESIKRAEEEATLDEST